MSGGGSFMDDNGFKDLVLQELKGIKEKLNDLPCVKYGINAATLKQSFENHVEEERKSIKRQEMEYQRKNLASNIWRIALMALNILIIIILAIVGLK